jgi:hypothetical protein
MEQYLKYNERLGIRLPYLDKDWELYPADVREYVVSEWEQIRGSIPERIKEFERVINARQASLNVEPVFIEAVRLNSEIADYASRINDLHLYFRMEQNVEIDREDPVQREAGKIHG